MHRLAELERHNELWRVELERRKGENARNLKLLAEREEERKRAAAPKERLVVEEGDVDMFS